jgi:transcription elongation factor Elf1
MSWITCPVCGSNNVKTVNNSADLSLLTITAECRECGEKGRLGA